MSNERYWAEVDVLIESIVVIDHQQLLRKYIRHVTMCEGTDFLDHVPGNSFATDGFSPAEMEELKRLAQS